MWPIGQSRLEDALIILSDDLAALKIMIDI
jgi:hypothetical protein